MSLLADTNIATRWILPTDPLHSVCVKALARLDAQGEEVFITPQVLVEFWAVATRPTDANGLGYPVPKVRSLIDDLLKQFPLLTENEEIYPTWLDLVERYGVVGRQVYDARLVAVMLTHGVTRILTLNGPHFRRFTEITAIDPASL